MQSRQRAGAPATPDAAINSVAEIIRAGAVGVNLEDGTPRGAAPIRNIADTADRSRAAREAARAVGVTDRHQHLHRSLLAQHRRRSGALRREHGAPDGMSGRRCGLLLSDRFARPATIARLMKAPAAPTN